MTRRNFGFSFVPRSGFHGANAAAGEHRQPRLSPAPVAADIMSRPVTLGGTSSDRPASSAKQYSRADLLAPFPRGSLIDPGNPLLESDDFIDAMRDCCRVVGAALFLTVTGLALVASVFITFFVDLG